LDAVIGKIFGAALFMRLFLHLVHFQYVTAISIYNSCQSMTNEKAGSKLVLPAIKNCQNYLILVGGYI